MFGDFSFAGNKAYVAEVTSVDRQDGGHIRRISSKTPSGEEIKLQSTLEANDHLFLLRAKIVYRQCGTIEIQQEAQDTEKDWLLPRTCDPGDNSILPDTPGTVTASLRPVGDPEIAKAFFRDIVGTNVYSSGGENIGEIQDILLSTDQKPTAVILGLGGFLGAGEKDVAVSFDKIELAKDGKGPVKFYVLYNQDELKAQSAFQLDTYPGQRTLLSDR